MRGVGIRPAIRSMGVPVPTPARPGSGSKGFRASHVQRISLSQPLPGAPLGWRDYRQVAAAAVKRRTRRRQAGSGWARRGRGDNMAHGQERTRHPPALGSARRGDPRRRSRARARATNGRGDPPPPGSTISSSSFATRTCRPPNCSPSRGASASRSSIRSSRASTDSPRSRRSSSSSTSATISAASGIPTRPISSSRRWAACCWRARCRPMAATRCSPTVSRLRDAVGRAEGDCSTA